MVRGGGGKFPVLGWQERNITTEMENKSHCWAGGGKCSRTFSLLQRIRKSDRALLPVPLSAFVSGLSSAATAFVLVRSVSDRGRRRENCSEMTAGVLLSPYIRMPTWFMRLSGCKGVRLPKKCREILTISVTGPRFGPFNADILLAS